MFDAENLRVKQALQCHHVSRTSAGFASTFSSYVLSIVSITLLGNDFFPRGTFARD